MHINYHNSILCGVPNYLLQSHQRLVCMTCRYRMLFVTPVLRDSQWLPVRECLNFKDYLKSSGLNSLKYITECAVV